MKVFVSGAAGFIGRAVVSELASRGHKVTGMVKNSDEAAAIKSAGVNPVIGDLFKAGQWCTEVKKADKVISLTKPFMTEDKIDLSKMEGLGRMHAEAVTNLIKAAAEGSAKGILLSYHTNCYGDRNGRWVENDAGAVDPVGYCRPLTGSFETIEEVVEESGIPAITLFPAMVYGNGGWFKRLVEDIRSGNAAMVGSGENYLNLIHIDDVAAIYALIAEQFDYSDVFVVSDNRPVTQKTLLEFTANLLDKSAPKMVDKNAWAKKAGIMAAEAMSCNTRTSAEKLLDRLEYKCVNKSYETGIPRTLKSMGIEPMEGEYRRVA